ncbi:GILT-like protein 1 [Amphibalanus amphitrite]|uniref:GILT-like protein 1 n=1 Tax=Amphibalanus amphitrite TaxID=1232801 RepID=UPI001C90E679|nr:GILT-like protein 1 [Amphibalanus amphitrite]XP_043217228.1 GILT-like protein 1 [Amphibalanus amphitrite]XP_043217229.1 GILT-like protein 1 [Amphibalanus amphitrite]XP_043217230.1 GILT-like protein 1 [Amphibalanus amphitrite]XP_043217231.1 GILT-like protein 1 [Amphibalanus amphitrite]XP_043217232.1 GILT-like protein 1 [Amphibalanus amphitrite]XP_043217233.1 GILT-like protein 1 [Amphibalanus amphitrite]XP_043217234.1 GILT-like protein 1 [Amphibalanus amphitrite]XP_043217235.1 GILT-like pr
MKVITGSPLLKLVAAVFVVLAFWLMIKYMTWEEDTMALPDTFVRPIIPAVPEDDEGIERTGHPVQVEVFYEALCPDSMNYIVDQLAPAVAKLPVDALNVILVPYGKAKTYQRGSKVTFSCQHGPEECWANKLHACGIRQAANQTVSVQFVTCLMRHYRRLRLRAQQCAEDSRLPWVQLSACAAGSAIDPDIVRYGEMTQALRPPAHFIPTITVDQSQDGQAAMFGNFLSFVCKAYETRSGKKPTGCPK